MDRQTDRQTHTHITHTHTHSRCFSLSPPPPYPAPPFPPPPSRDSLRAQLHRQRITFTPTFIIRSSWPRTTKGFARNLRILSPRHRGDNPSRQAERAGRRVLGFETALLEQLVLTHTSKSRVSGRAALIRGTSDVSVLLRCSGQEDQPCVR